MTLAIINKALLSRRAIVVLILVTVALALRLPGIGETMTVDEYNWMYRSATFWHKLQAGDVKGTFITTHPAATVTWLSGAGIIWQEKALQQGLSDENLRHFRAYASAPIVLAAVATLALIGFLAMRLWGTFIGGVMALWLVTDPYLVGMNRVVHPDALLGLFMVATLLSALWYLQHRQRRWLWITAGLLSLSLATKLIPTLWLLLALAVIALVTQLRNKVWPNWRTMIAEIIMVVLIAAALFAIMWPTVLSVPDLQLGYLSRDAENILTQEHVALSVSETPINPNSFYGRSFLGRVTPYTQVLVLVALALLVIKKGALVGGKGSQGRIWWLLLYAVGFLVLITLASKKADRYALPALVVFPLIAGWALAQVIRLLGERPNFFGRWRTVILTAGVVALVAVPLVWAPHAVAYNNPLFKVRPLSQQGWGEGLELAAAWLNTHPLGTKLSIASWYPSVTQTYFQGQTFSLSSRNDYRVGYVITYRNMGGRAGDTQGSDVLDEFRDQEPVHTVQIGGLDYVWIYQTEGVGNFLKHVGEITGAIEVGQIVRIEQSELSAVEIGFATFSGRENTKDVTLRVYAELDDPKPLREVIINASTIPDNRWQRFSFDPIPKAAGREFYISITSPNSIAGNAVTVRYSDEDLIPGQMVLLRQGLQFGEKRSEFKKPGDIALRIVGGEL